MPTARTASSNITCLLPEPSWSQTVLLFFHTPQASPAMPSKEPEQERWSRKKEQGRKQGEGGGGGRTGGRRHGGPKNTKQMQKVRGSRRQRPTSQTKGRGNRTGGQAKKQQKKQELSLAAHSERLKPEHANRFIASWQRGGKDEGRRAVRARQGRGK